MDEDASVEANKSVAESVMASTANSCAETGLSLCHQCQLVKATNSQILSEYTRHIKCYNLRVENDIMGQNDAPGPPLDFIGNLEFPDLLTEEQRADLIQFCRICHDADTEETLITPCRCKGTLSMVHRSCLEKWLAASDSSNCELCGQFYVTLRTPRYRYLPSVVSWLRCEENCRDVRELILDLMALCVFTPMALLGTYLGLFAAENFYMTELDPNRRDLTSARLVTLIVMSLMATIDLAYVSWLTVRTQYHIQQWYAWWRRQCTVKLFLPDELNPPSNQTFEKKSEIPATSQNEFLPVESNDRCSTHTSGSSRNMKDDFVKGDLGSGKCLGPSALTDVYKVTLYDPARVESWCRICQESKSEVLVSPCRCRGTQGLVHLSCLERWLTISGTSACEVCFYPYCVKTVPKYSPFISIFVWIYKGGNKKYMACDLAILLLLTTTMTWMIKHAWYLNQKDNPQYFSPGVAFLTAVFTIAYFFLVYTTIRYYYKKWLSWHKTNQQGLRVILPPDCRSMG